MKTTVLFFGALAEITGKGSVEVADCSDTDAVQHAVLQQFPQLSERKYALALNKQLLRSNAPVQEGSTLAFLPPFSGG
ncbi:molybdopterin synthase subunit MoaD [Cnuella takakiae]|uniref:Molybdopterin synthase subunit MoaD n=1 Tax=Cnuella takakiae TaxID=1302690 RepID=A0A1M4YH31_9BACT|nr:MoaD/ThiS family protein [Cnuella takakiae]OLY94880.1 hypothetical protein BUE76_15575 [Cnuella takakiae]SHF05075.1 molybdopterin synthase subunit MoaD [Cnuella takakiae]